MTTEELKMVLEALTALGAEGKSAFMLWVLADKIAPILGWLGTVGGLGWVALRMTRTLVTKPIEDPRTPAERMSDEVRHFWLYQCPSNSELQVRAYELHVAAQEVAKQAGARHEQDR